MNRLLISIGGLIALYVAAAWAFTFPPFKPAPVFYENVAREGQSFTCNGGEGPSIFIRFQQDGRIAIVRAGGRVVRLSYKTSDSMFDIYESSPWQLTLDPEANLTGPAGLRFGNCF